MEKRHNGSPNGLILTLDLIHLRDMEREQTKPKGYVLFIEQVMLTETKTTYLLLLFDAHCCAYCCAHCCTVPDYAYGRYASAPAGATPQFGHYPGIEHAVLPQVKSLAVPYVPAEEIPLRVHFPAVSKLAGDDISEWIESLQASPIIVDGRSRPTILTGDIWNSFSPPSVLSQKCDGASTSSKTLSVDAKKIR
uniref:Uncharacterized protein n=1 Tax=Glossina pallidipes TaxID=7398 RepID=A0A1B0A0K4_GLOPL